MKTPVLICLMGTECTGKTTLAQTLARHFAGLWVPEYLRTFCDLHGRTPHPEEQSLIVQTQLDHEAQAITQARQKGCMHVFCDTAPLLTAIYSDYIFADRTLYARARALHTRYALTLALAPDLPWQADGLQREGAHVRAPPVRKPPSRQYRTSQKQPKGCRACFNLDSAPRLFNEG